MRGRGWEITVNCVEERGRKKKDLEETWIVLAPVNNRLVVELSFHV